jgi:hypothetical protein
MFGTMLQRDRKRWGLRLARASWLLGVSVADLRELEGRHALARLRHLRPDLQAVRLAGSVRG